MSKYFLERGVAFSPEKDCCRNVFKLKMTGIQFWLKYIYIYIYIYMLYIYIYVYIKYIYRGREK